MESEDVQMQNNWTVAYNPNQGSENVKFLMSNIVSGIKQEQTLGTLDLKVKAEVEPQETVIKIKNIKSNDGSTLVSETDKEIKIKILGNTQIPQESPTPEVTETPLAPNTQTPSSQVTNTPTPETKPTSSVANPNVTVPGIQTQESPEVGGTTNVQTTPTDNTMDNEQEINTIGENTLPGTLKEVGMTIYLLPLIIVILIIVSIKYENSIKEK